ncbi:hypothetical protein [Caudoviricetes sp.]|nr:hypothetical protein [Caudoviricetes sp.]
MTKSSTPHDKFGFPVKNCTRCGGTGHYSFNMIDGTRCYGCGGTGFAPLNKKVRVARGEYLEAVRKAREPIARDLRPGDFILVDSKTNYPLYSKNKECQFVEVAAVESAGQHDWLVITYVDGRSSPPTINACQIVRRKADIDPAPWVMKATA